MIEKVVAGVALATLAFVWSAGATAVERLGKVPQIELRVDKHDTLIEDIRKAQEAEALGRGRLIELLEREARERRAPRR